MKEIFPGFHEEYNFKILQEKDIDANPIREFSKWLQEAISNSVVMADAMILSTVSELGKPSSRVVLLKSVSEKGFLFFSNYKSKKGIELEFNANASLIFFWPQLQQQIRIEGRVEKADSEISDEYFNSRPYESNVNAIISPQSQIIPDKEYLEKKRISYFENTQELTRPNYWGGYILVPTYFEFWQGRPNRLHDRIIYQKEDNGWIINRLAP